MKLYFWLMISIVVPVLNEEKTLSIFLESLLSQQGVDFEIILVDGGSSDRTLSICAEFPEVKAISSPKGRANQMNRGALEAKGEILLFLHADTLLPIHGLKAIEKAMDNPKLIGGSFFMKFDAESLPFRFYSAFTKINSAYFTYGDQALFVRKAVFEEVGTFKPLPILEDFEIQKRLRRKGKFIKLPLAVTTSARRFLHHGVFRQQLMNILLLMAFELGFPPAKIKKFYSDLNR
jgi:rSAM/selenodomain-associated transferase 2